MINICRYLAVFVLAAGTAAMGRPASADGVAGNALRFDGGFDGEFDLGDFVNIPDDLSLSLGGAMTVEAWVLLEADPDGFEQMAFLSKGLGFGNYTLEVLGGQSLATPGSASFVFDFFDGESGGNQSCCAGTPLVAFGGWSHVAGTYSPPNPNLELPGIHRLYVNGQQVGQDVTSVLPETVFGNVFLGRVDFASDDVEFPDMIFYQGVLDEVRIWNVARTADEIASNFNKTVDPDNSPGLVGYWNFDEALDDQNVFDQSPEGNHGTLGAVLDEVGPAADDPERIASTAPLVGNLEECPFNVEQLSVVCAGSDVVVFYSDEPAFNIGPAPCTCPGVTVDRCSPEDTGPEPCFPEGNEVFSSTVLEIVTTSFNPRCKKVCYDIDGMRVCEKICK